MQSRIPSWKRIGLQLTGKIADNSLERNAAGSSESKISETGLRHETTSANKSVVKTVPLQKGRTDGQQGLSDRQIARTRGKASQRKDALVSPDCSDPAGSASGQALGSSRTPASNVAHQSVPSGDEPTNTYEGQSSSPGLGQHTREGPLGAPRDSHGSGKQIEVRVAHRREDEQSKTEQSIHPHQEVLIGDKEDSSSRTHAPSQVASATADSNVNDRIQDGKRKRRSETKLNDPTAPEQKKVVKKMKRDKQRLDGGPEGRGQGNSDHAIDTQTPNHESKRTGQPSSLEASKADKTPVEPQSSNTSEQQRSRHPGNSALGSRKPNKPPSPSSSSPVHLHPALTYLLEFHHHSDTWRFIKSRQAYLLKHFFDLHFIPEIYTPALQSYIVGLKGDHPRGILLKAAAETITMAPHRRAHPRADAHSSSTHGLTEDMIEGKFAKKANEDPHKIDYVQTEEEEGGVHSSPRRSQPNTSLPLPDQVTRAALVIELFGGDDEKRLLVPTARTTPTLTAGSSPAQLSPPPLAALSHSDTDME